MPVRVTNTGWLWALLPLLLAAALVVPALDKHIFDVDEASTMINAGARHLGPSTPAEAVARSLSRSPDQAWGHAVIYSQWGQIVGWSEIAIRSLPWFTGLLTLAWVFRIGRDLCSLRSALLATLLLATSILFLVYMHNVRPYGLSMLFAAITLWAYWRVALRPRLPGRCARIFLLAGATGLLYSHYFCALLLPALALFHLFHVRKERRWWQPVFLLGLAGLLALPQIPGLLGGIEFNLGKENLHQKALAYPGVMSLFLRYLSNDLLEFQQPFSTLFALSLPMLLLISGWHSRRRHQPPGAVRYLSLTSVLLLLLLAGLNEWLQVLDWKRARYMAALWPPVMLFISMVFMQSRTLLRPVAGIILVALVAFSGVNDFLREGDLVRHSWPNLPVTLTSMRAIAGEGSANGLLAVDRSLFSNWARTYELYTGAYEERRVHLKQNLSYGELLERAQGLDMLWLLLPGENEEALRIQAHIERLNHEGWIHTRSLREAGISLDQFLSPFATARLQFESVATIYPAKELLLRDGLMHFRANLSSADEAVPERFSLAVHVIDPLTGERVAQGDVGVGPDKFAQLRSEIDVSELPPGEYEVHVALYDWRTGARMSARDLETGVTGDVHVLHSFNIA